MKHLYIDYKNDTFRKVVIISRRRDGAMIRKTFLGIPYGKEFFVSYEETGKILKVNK